MPTLVAVSSALPAFLKRHPLDGTNSLIKLSESDIEFKNRLISFFSTHRMPLHDTQQRINFTTFFSLINNEITKADAKEKINCFWIYIAHLLLMDINHESRADLHAAGFLRQIGAADNDAILFRTILHTQLFGYNLAYMASIYPDNWTDWVTSIHVSLRELVAHFETDPQQRQLWQDLLQSILGRIKDGPKKNDLLVYQFYFMIINPFKPEVLTEEGPRTAQITQEFLYANPMTRKDPIPELLTLLKVLSDELIEVTGVLPTASPASSSVPPGVGPSIEMSPVCLLPTSTPLVQDGASPGHASSSSMPRELSYEVSVDPVLAELMRIIASLDRYDAAKRPTTTKGERVFDSLTGREIKPIFLSLYPSSVAIDDISVPSSTGTRGKGAPHNPSPSISRSDYYEGSSSGAGGSHKTAVSSGGVGPTPKQGPRTSGVGLYSGSSQVSTTKPWRGASDAERPLLSVQDWASDSDDDVNGCACC